MPILMYHSVEDAPLAPKYKHLHVTAAEFARHMRALKRAGYTAMDFQELADCMDGRRALPLKPVLLTFDDGYKNLRKNVHPLLCRMGMPYTVFLVSECVGGRNEWDISAGHDARELLGWPDIQAMLQDGYAQFAPHSVTHPPLAKIPFSEAALQMAQSKDVLEQRLGRAMSVFCYPYGSANADLAAEARRIGYTMAVTTQTGRVRRGDNRLLLPRISVYHVPAFSLTYGVGHWNFWWRVKSWKDKRPPADAP